MAVDYGIYTLLEIYQQIFQHAPSNASELAMVRTFMESYGGIPTSSSMNYYVLPHSFFTSKTYTGSQSLVVPGSSASSAWTAYKEASGAISQLTGGATQGNQIVKSAVSGYYRVPEAGSPSGYLYKPAALLKMPLPTAAAAIAPLAGVAIGASLYDDNPALWTKLSRALLPWAYPDGDQLVDVSKGLMPVWTEVAESAGELIARALLPAALVDSIKQVFADEGIGGDTSGYISTQYPEYGTVPATSGMRFGPNYLRQTIEISDNSATVYGVYLVTGTGGQITQFPITCSSAPYKTRSVTPDDPGGTWYPATHDTLNGRDIYYTGGGSYSGSGVMPQQQGAPHYRYYDTESPTAPDTLITAYIILYGIETGLYPEGTSKYGDGSAYPLPAQPKQIITLDENGNERAIDAYPVPLPLTPGQSPDASTQTIDDPLVDISKQVDPYIQPTSDPYTDPAPDDKPRTDPEDDPTKEGKPDNPIDPDGPTDTPPPSEGDTPDPTPPVIPPPFTSSGGLIAVYNPTQSILVDFANWLWVTYDDATIQKIWNNPFDGVISLHELYATPPVIGSRTIKSGFLDSQISCPIIGRYTEINCGSIVIPEYWNNYLDYAPYSKAFVYLPFIGIVELEADDIVGHAVNITYKIDCYNGSCIAIITVAKEGPDGSIYNNSVYQFSGNCAVEVPLTGGTQANIKAAIINATAWGLGSVISGLVTAAGSGPIAGLAGAGQAISGAMQATASVVNAKSSVQHSGSFGASFGAMGIKTPYIIVKRPIQVQVLNYNEIYGYQAHKAVTIGTCEGYLRCREVHVVSATASNEEKNRIEELLKTGVIV